MNLLNGDTEAVLDQIADEYNEASEKKMRFALKLEYNKLAAEINRQRGKHIYNTIK
jgi:hypothetical protein